MAQGGFSLFDNDISLFVHADISLDANSGISSYGTSAKPVSPSGVGAEAALKTLLILMSLCQQAYSFTSPWSLGFLICLFILTLPSSLLSHFLYLLVLSHPVLQQHQITPFQILSQTSVHF